MADQRIEIEDLPSTITQARTDMVPAQKPGGSTNFLTIAQMLGLINASDLGNGLNSATSDDTIDDTDQVLYLSGSTLKKAGFLSGLIASIFKTTRTIANVVVQASTFRMKNAGGFSPIFDATALTADRNFIMPNKDVDLGLVPYVILGASVNLSTTLVDFAIPAAPSGRALQELEIGLTDVTLSAAQTLMAQFLVGGTPVGSGYTGTASGGGTSVASTSYTSFIGLVHSATINTFQAVNLTLKRLAPGSNRWRWTMQGQTPGFIIGSGWVDLAGEPSAVRLSTSSGSPTFTQGVGSLIRRHS